MPEYSLSGNVEERYQIWNQVDKQFDWQYISERVSELSFGKPLKGCTYIRRGNRRYAILGVAHINHSDHPSSDTHERQQEDIFNAAAIADVVYAEELMDTVFQIPKVKPLTDYDEIRQCGGGDVILGSFLIKDAYSEILKDYNQVMKEKMTSDSLKFEIMFQVGASIAACRECYEMVGCVRETLSYLDSVWPYKFPEIDDDPIAVFRRSLLQGYQVIDRECISNPDDNILIIIGALHEPHIVRILTSPKIDELDLMYHTYPTSSDSVEELR